MTSIFTGSSFTISITKTIPLIEARKFGCRPIFAPTIGSFMSHTSQIRLERLTVNGLHISLILWIDPYNKLCFTGCFDEDIKQIPIHLEIISIMTISIPLNEVCGWSNMVFTHDSVEFFFNFIIVRVWEFILIGYLQLDSYISQSLWVYSNVSTNHRALFKNVKKMFLELFIVLANGKLASSLFPKIILRQ